MEVAFGGAYMPFPLSDNDVHGYEYEYFHPAGSRSAPARQERSDDSQLSSRPPYRFFVNCEPSADRWLATV
eukprot:scaffold586936_cov20-Prasinocladus_malaysianus.AAC.1